MAPSVLAKLKEVNCTSLVKDLKKNPIWRERATNLPTEKKPSCWVLVNPTHDNPNFTSLSNVVCMEQCTWTDSTGEKTENLDVLYIGSEVEVYGSLQSRLFVYRALLLRGSGKFHCH